MPTDKAYQNNVAELVSQICKLMNLSMAGFWLSSTVLVEALMDCADDDLKEVKQIVGSEWFRSTYDERGGYLLLSQRLLGDTRDKVFDLNPFALELESASLSLRVKKGFLADSALPNQASLESLGLICKQFDFYRSILESGKDIAWATRNLLAMAESVLVNATELYGNFDETVFDLYGITFYELSDLPGVALAYQIGIIDLDNENWDEHTSLEKLPLDAQLGLERANYLLRWVQTYGSPKDEAGDLAPRQLDNSGLIRWIAPDNAFADLIVELVEKGYIAAATKTEALNIAAPHFTDVNRDGDILLQGLNNKAYLGTGRGKASFSGIPAASELNPKKPQGNFSSIPRARRRRGAKAETE
jgi:hypothetical protein